MSDDFEFDSPFSPKAKFHGVPVFTNDEVPKGEVWFVLKGDKLTLCYMGDLKFDKRSCHSVRTR